MLEVFVFALWSCVVAYSTWYFTSAKHYAPITSKEARILWKIHKRNVRCSSRKWREIKHGTRTIGLECECGYRHIQRRPIVANSPTPHVKSRKPQTSIFDELHNSYRAK